MGSTKRLIKLAENPEDDFGAYDDDEGAEGEDTEGGGDDEFSDDMEMKGRSVSGPRTKLASTDDLTMIKNSVAALAKSVHALARVQKAMLEKGDDDEDEDDEDGKEDKGAPAKAVASTVSKDDAASSFGEKDSDVPGNRPYDQTSPGESDTIIQGGPAAGPGPVSKSRDGGITPKQLQRMINNSVRDAMESMGVASIVHKSDGPGVGTSSQIGKADADIDIGDLFTQLKGRSFREINALRVQMGDLPASVL